MFGKIILYVWFLNYIEKPSAWLGCVVVEFWVYFVEKLFVVIDFFICFYDFG